MQNSVTCTFGLNTASRTPRLAAAGKAAVIPPRPNRLTPRDFDRELYQERHLIKNFFCKLAGDRDALR